MAAEMAAGSPLRLRTKFDRNVNQNGRTMNVKNEMNLAREETFLRLKKEQNLFNAIHEHLNLHLRFTT